MRCRSDCTGELKVNEDGTIDGASACPVELLLKLKAVMEARLGLKAPMEIEEAVWADYALWSEVDRGWTVVALADDSPLMTMAWKGKSEAFMIVTKEEETKNLRYRRGMVLADLASDGETLVDATPQAKGLWFEVPNKPYLVRPWTGASQFTQRMRWLAILANRQALKANCEAPFGEAFKVQDLKGVLGTRSNRRTMATAHTEAEVPPSITMKEGGWKLMGTMVKYIDDADPFGKSGINLTDVVVRRNKVIESTDTAALMASLKMHMQPSPAVVVSELENSYRVGPRGLSPPSVGL